MLHLLIDISYRVRKIWQLVNKIRSQYPNVSEK